MAAERPQAPNRNWPVKFVRTLLARFLLHWKRCMLILYRSCWLLVQSPVPTGELNMEGNHVQPCNPHSNAAKAAGGPLATCVGVMLLAAACSTAYYGALEKMGIEKRDILVDRIGNARDAQEDAKEQFASALDQYRSVVTFDGGELEEIYDRLNNEYQRSEARASQVSERIEAVESVAEDLFEEWEEEIGDYSDPALARRSRQLLGETRTEYASVISAMHRAEGAMEPVLTLFNDQVMFLRHNLNARAIGSLETELGTIEAATADLIREMERSIAEAGRFIESMR